MNTPRSKPWLLLLLAAGALAGLAAWDTDERTLTLLTNTACLAAGTCCIALPAGTLLAVLINRTDVRGRRLAWAGLIALLFLPLYLQAAGWDAWFGRLGWQGAMQGGPASRWVAVIWIHGLAATAWAAVIVGAGLRQVPPELEELALLEMPPAAVVLRVTLPLSRAAVYAAAWWVCAMAAGEMTVTDLYQVRTFAEEIYTTLPLVDPGLASGSDGVSLPRGTSILVLALLCALLLIAYAARHDTPSTPRTRLSLSLLRWNVPFAALQCGIVGLAVGVPLASLAGDAGMEIAKDASGALHRSWSSIKLLNVVALSPWHFRMEVLWTLLVGGGAAMLAMLIAVPCAWLSRTNATGRWLTFVLTALLAALPGPWLAVLLIACLNREESATLVWLYDHTLLAPILAAAARALPLALAISWWAFRTIPAELLDLARLDGLGLFGQLRHLAWPLRRELLLVGFCVSLAVAAGDLGATLLLTPPGVRTLAMRIFGLLHAGVDDQVAGICLFNALLHICLAVAVSCLLRWHGEREA